MTPKIEYIPHSVAYTIEQNGHKHIQMNKALLKYPKLYEQVLQHELGHLERDSMLSNILYDLLDLRNAFNIDMLKFCLKEKSTWRSMIPFYMHDGEIVYNISLISQYIIMIVIIFLAL